MLIFEGTVSVSGEGIEALLCGDSSRLTVFTRQPIRLARHIWAIRRKLGRNSQLPVEVAIQIVGPLGIAFRAGKLPKLTLLGPDPR